MRKTTKLLCAAVLCGISAISFADTKIGVVDLNKVIQTSPQIQTMQAQLKQKFDLRSKDILAQQDMLKIDLDKYKQNNTSLKGNALKTAQQKLLDEQKKLQDSRVSYQQDLLTAQNEALKPILQQIEAVVSKVAQAQKLNVVVTKISVAYNDPQLEITDQVINELKAQAPLATPASAPVAAPAPAKAAQPATK